MNFASIEKVSFEENFFLQNLLITSWNLNCFLAIESVFFCYMARAKEIVSDLYFVRNGLPIIGFSVMLITLIPRIIYTLEIILSALNEG